MATLQLKPMKVEDIEEVVLRDWEALEVRDINYKATLTTMFEGSDEAIAVRVDGKLALLFGHFSRSLYQGSGVAWMIATPVAEENWISFAKLSLKVIKQLGLIYPEVYTATYPGNTRAIRFLKWLGFRKHYSMGNTLTMVRG